MAAALLALAPAGGTQAQSSQRCFGETGFCIAGRIREFWEQNGGLPVFGLPITPQQQEELVEGSRARCSGSSATGWSCTPRISGPTMCCWAGWASIA